MSFVTQDCSELRVYEMYLLYFISLIVYLLEPLLLRCQSRLMLQSRYIRKCTMQLTSNQLSVHFSVQEKS